MMAEEDALQEWGRVASRPQLGSILRRVREERGIAQIDLAGAAGVQRSTISAIENAQRSINIETLMPLLRALGVEIWIRDRADDPNNYTYEDMMRRHSGNRNDV